jgi:iron complex outermembrane recepter protein
MLRRTKVYSGLVLAFGGTLGTSVTPAFAQQQQLDRVEITGSRIVRPGLTASTPVLSFGLETFGNIGAENFADVAQQLPQFAAAFGQSRTQSTFSGVETSGLNTINLRNLGSVRSLVLINGRRVPGGLSTDPSVDFNTIPTANVERIEVITGGASAIYGADAVGGVVNIITKKRFEGVEVTLGYGKSEKGDNTNPSAALMLGGKFGDSGRGLLTFEFDKQGRVSCADRYICSEDFAWTNPTLPARRGPAAQSGVPLNGRFFADPPGASYTRRGGSLTDANGALIPFSVAIDGYNRNAQRDIAIPTKRTLVAGDVEFAIAAKTSVFGEFNFGQSVIDSSFEAHPFTSNNDLLGGVQAATIPWNNPFIPAALLAAQPPGETEMTWFQRFADLGGNRGARSERSTVRTVVGIKGELDSLFGLGNGWRWEASNIYGRTRVNLNTEGLVGLNELYNGLRVEADPANPGGYRCVDAVARASGCVPINPFAPYTQAMINYASLGSAAIGTSTLNDTVVHITGSPFEVPAGPVRTAVGAEYRAVSGYLDYDSIVNRGLATGNQIGDTDYVKTRTREFFGEALVPILTDQPYAKSVNVEGAYRGSKSGGSNYNTWKLGGDWEPVDGLRFRAMQAKAVRTPVSGELSGIATTAGVVNDPCTAARRNANPTRAANCAADGVPVDYAPPLLVEQSVQGLTGGNPSLKPEEGKTLTYGLVWAPSRTFSLTIDRFDIKIKELISTVERQLTADLCYDTPNRLLCGSVTRGTNPLLPGANYVLTAVNEQLQNVATMHIAGVDVDAKYAFGLEGYGNVDLSLLATLYDKAVLVPLAGEKEVSLLGQAGGSTGDQGYIRMTMNGNVGYRLGKFKANWNLRHIGRADMAPGTTEAGYPKIGAHTYHNARVGYEFAKDSEVFGGVTNLFNKQPPFFASGTSGTQALDTIPGYYDIFGRSFFVGVRAKF